MGWAAIGEPSPSFTFHSSLRFFALSGESFASPGLNPLLPPSYIYSGQSLGLTCWPAASEVGCLLVVRMRKATAAITSTAATTTRNWKRPLPRHLIAWLQNNAYN